MAAGAAFTAARGGAWITSAVPRAQAASQAAGGPLPISGEPAPELAAFDRAVAELMAAWAVPGAQLAVAKDGRLVLDRGYGFGDVEAGEPVRPESLFRIASVSKTLTAVAVLTLVDDGKLALEDRAFPLLALRPPAGATVDPRLDVITVRDLLVHAGGWDGVAPGDPQFLPWSRTAAATVGAPDPPDGLAIVRFMLGTWLDSDPGTKSVYSNFGFNVLGRVIEQVSGQPYAAFVQERVLAPAGVTGMRIGRTRLAERARGEVRYYPPPEYPTVPSVFPGEGFVPMPYGNYYVEAMDAHGGWIASAADLLRFATAVDGQRGPALLQPATVEAMLHAERPPAEGPNGAANTRPATGLGWVVQPGPGGLTWAHTGLLSGGTGAYLARIESGVAIAFVGNSIPADGFAYLAAVTGSLPAVAAEIGDWPDHDLFGTSA